MIDAIAEETAKYGLCQTFNMYILDISTCLTYPLSVYVINGQTLNDVLRSNRNGGWEQKSYRNGNCQKFHLADTQLQLILDKYLKQKWALYHLISSKFKAHISLH